MSLTSYRAAPPRDKALRAFSETETDLTNAEAPIPSAPVPGGGFEIPDEALDVPSFLRDG